MRKITFQSVNKSFGNVDAINDLNITIVEGDIYALLGHNGAGKTTTLRLLLGLLQTDVGKISVFGHDPIKQGNAIRKMCGVLSEDVGLYEPLSVYDNLIYYASIYKMKKDNANKRIDELLEFFELQEQKYLPVKGFSTGMKKKVAIIRAILHNPRILLLDEPTNGLDPVSTMKLREMLLTLAKENHTTIIMTTHNLEEVQKLCNKISIFRRGKNIYTSEISKLKESKHYLENGQFSLEKLYMDIEGRELL